MSIEKLKTKEKYGFDDLVSIVGILRSKNGCPWDRVQTHQSIRMNFIEEVYEAIEAIDTDDMLLLREELGDVLLQIMLHSNMEAEVENFDVFDVINDVSTKLVYRHPHIFSDVVADTTEQVNENWEQLKKVEKGHTSYSDLLTSVPKTLPALMYSKKIAKRAAKSGFDYENVGDAVADLKRELAEFEQALENGDKENIYEELGDMLFSVSNVGRKLGISSEQALVDSSNKFIRRFALCEQLADERFIEMEKADLDTLNGLWKEAKEGLRNK